VAVHSSSEVHMPTIVVVAAVVSLADVVEANNTAAREDIITVVDAAGMPTAATAADEKPRTPTGTATTATGADALIAMTIEMATG